MEKSIEEIKSVIETTGNQSSWEDLLVEPHNRGNIYSAYYVLHITESSTGSGSV